jgi:hypothetical protein
MMFFFSLIPATLLVVLGFFVMYASSKAEGGVKTCGKMLYIWIYILAGLVVLGGIFGPMMGMGRHSDRMGRYMQYKEHRQQMQQPAMPGQIPPQKQTAPE